MSPLDFKRKVVYLCARFKQNLIISVEIRCLFHQ